MGLHARLAGWRAPREPPDPPRRRVVAIDEARTDRRWLKTFVRVHAGRKMLSGPVRMSPDPAIDFAGFPARPRATRAMVADTNLLQIERKRNAPMFL